MRKGMLKKNLWLKIAVVIIIQSLVLTQVDFALASLCNNTGTYQKVALRCQKMVSLIDGAGCVQAILSLHLPNLNFQSLLSIFQGDAGSIADITLQKVRHIDNNHFYKVFAMLNNINNLKNKFTGIIEKRVALCGFINQAITEESTGPPMILVNNDVFLSRTV